MEFKKDDVIHLSNDFFSMFKTYNSWAVDYVCNFKIKKVIFEKEEKFQIFFSLIKNIFLDKEKDTQFMDRISPIIKILFKTTSKFDNNIYDTFSLLKNEFDYYLENNQVELGSLEDYKDNLESVLFSFLSNKKIEIKIIEFENLQTSFEFNEYEKIKKEFEEIDVSLENNDFITVGNKIEQLYTTKFLAKLFNEEKVNKQKVVIHLENCNSIIKELDLKNEFDNIYKIISNIRNGIKASNSVNKTESSKKISEVFKNKTIKEQKSFVKLYIDFSKTLFNFIINNLEIENYK